jgi:hypothetical protein
LQTVKNLVFGLLYAGWYLQLSNVKPTQVCSAQAGRQVTVFTKAKGAPQRELISALEKAHRLLEQKLTGSQYH